MSSTQYVRMNHYPVGTLDDVLICNVVPIYVCDDGSHTWGRSVVKFCVCFAIEVRYMQVKPSPALFWKKKIGIVDTDVNWMKKKIILTLTNCLKIKVFS